MINETGELLRRIITRRFVRSALQNVVYNKLLFDGYVCCSNGLYPSNKKVLLEAITKQSPFYNVIDKKPDSYVDLLNRIEAVEIDDGTALSMEESQSVVYAILETDKNNQKSDILFFLLNEIFIEML